MVTLKLILVLALALLALWWRLSPSPLAAAAGPELPAQYIPSLPPVLFKEVS